MISQSPVAEGATQARVIEVKQLAQGAPYVPVRLEGLDAPEEHYEATAFTQTVKGVKRSFPKRTNRKGEFAQPQWKAATDYLLGTLSAAGHALVQLDREVTGRYGRVLGYVYASDAVGTRGEFVSRELLARVNLPMVFRRIVDAYQLQGLSLREALRKYDAIDYGSGKVFAGDKFWKVPVERRIWAPAGYG